MQALTEALPTGGGHSGCRSESSPSLSIRINALYPSPVSWSLPELKSSPFIAAAQDQQRPAPGFKGAGGDFAFPPYAGTLLSGKPPFQDHPTVRCCPAFTYTRSPQTPEHFSHPAWSRGQCSLPAQPGCAATPSLTCLLGFQVGQLPACS